MRRSALALTPLLVSLILAQACGAQASKPQLTREQVVERVCRAPEIKSGSEFDEIQRIERKLAPIVNRDKQHFTTIALVNSNVVNAWATNFNIAKSLICVPIAMVHFMGDAEGELAFIMSHEIGHTVDDQCKTAAGRAQIGQAAAPMRSFLGALLGGGNGATAATQLATQRSCEARADAIGFYIFTASGYNPFDAAGAFGRLEMYLGDTSTGVFARLAAMGSNHPMTPDRIRHMRALLINYEQQHAAR